MNFSLLTFNIYVACGNCLSVIISGLAHVSSRILWINIQDVQRNVTEIVGGFKAMASWNRSSIEEPLHLHVGIIGGSERTLEMGALALKKVF